MWNEVVTTLCFGGIRLRRLVTTLWRRGISFFQNVTQTLTLSYGVRTCGQNRSIELAEIYKTPQTA
jgi:hypothetical protein